MNRITLIMSDSENTTDRGIRFETSKYEIIVVEFAQWLTFP